MSKTLEQILGYTAMTGVISNPAGGVPDDILDPGWMNLTEPIDGDSAEWMNIQGERKAATTVARGSASRKIKTTPIGQIRAKCITSFEHVTHPLSLLGSLRNFDNPQAQMRAEQIIDAKSMEFRRRFMNLRLSAVYSMLATGLIGFDGDGELLGPNATPFTAPTNTVTLVDFKIPAAQKGNLGGLIAADWSTAGTDILGQIKNVVSAARKLGARLTTAYYGSAIPGYLAGNTVIKELMKSDSALTSNLRQGIVPRIGEIDRWVPINQAFTDINGTATDWFPSDFVVFTAEPDRSWYSMLEGTFEMPTANTLGADAADVAAGFRTINGLGGYAEIVTDAPGIKHYGFDTFLPALKNSAFVWIANTVA